MTWRDLLQLAWQAVWFHRQRSLLTMLGILIGVASVILLTSTFISGPPSWESSDH